MDRKREQVKTAQRVATECDRVPSVLSVLYGGVVILMRLMFGVAPSDSAHFVAGLAMLGGCLMHGFALAGGVLRR